MFVKICGFLLIFVQVALSVPRDLYAGSKCQTFHAPGLCTPITNCTLALEAVKENGFHDLKRCGFERFTEIVCCPSLEYRNTKTTTPEPNDDKAASRGSDPVRKCEKACQKYSKNLPIVLSYHIVGGEDAAEGEFPHMAALGFYSTEEQTYNFDCGGTLISDAFVVTAAHCLINVQRNELKIVRLGVISVPQSVAKPDPKFDYNVDNVTVHKDYNWKEKINDIALVKLQRKVTFTDTIRPACLYSRNDDPERLMVTGWGAVGLGGERSTVLQKATLNPVSLQECNATYQTRTSRYITKSQLCASDNIRDACQGDSGGPLQTQSNTSILTIVGVTSYGIGCGSKYPGIYTRISSYLDWIEAIVWP